MTDPVRATLAYPVSFPSVFTTPAELEPARERLADVSAKFRSPHVYTASFLAGYIKRLAGSGTINPVGLREALAVAEAWTEWVDLPESGRRQTCAMCGRVLTPNVFHTCPGPRIVSTGTAGLEPRADKALSTELPGMWEPADFIDNAPDVTEGPEIVAADGSVA